MSTPGNSINQSTTGVCGFTGTSFTASPLTQYLVNLGGASSHLIDQVSGTGTVGQVLTSNGSGVKPTWQDAGGLTNITNGIGSFNLGLVYSSPTATIKGADGNDLSADNPGFLTIPSNVTSGKLITVKLTANKTFQDSTGTSVFAGSLFGFSTGDVTTNKTSSTPSATGVIFYLHAVLDGSDTNPIFFAAPRGYVYDTGTVIFDAASGSADSFIDAIALESVTIANYQNRNAIIVGSFRMDKTAGDDWTITSTSTLTGLGIGTKDYPTASAQPLGAIGAAASSVFRANGGTAPTVNSSSVIRYHEFPQERTLQIDYQITLSGTPAGAVAAQLVAPPKSDKGVSDIRINGTYEKSTGERYFVSLVEVAGTDYFVIYKNDGTSAQWTYEEMASGDKLLIDEVYRY